MKVLSLAYAGNIEWFCHLLGGDCIIDLHEHYHKQSYRSRCLIMTANGVVPLSVQVARPDNWPKTAMRNVRLDYSKRWQHQHWTSIVSAYRNSPYFDHYAGALEPFYHRRFDFLADLDAALLDALLTALGSDLKPRYSERYIDTDEVHLHAGERVEDLRYSRSTAPTYDPHFAPQEYYQVFSDRQPFAPNLSVVDLLMCEGPGAMEILRQSHR